MRRVIIGPLGAILCVGVLLLASGTALGASPNTYQITPDQTTMAIGESRSFRMVDENGQAQHKVRWTLSDVDASQETEGDEFHLYASRVGEFRLMARTDFATAEDSIKVVEAKDIKQGTIRWHAGEGHLPRDNPLMSGRPLRVRERQTCPEQRRGISRRAF